jgi:ketosteroid isomerase-like protein
MGWRHVAAPLALIMLCNCSKAPDHDHAAARAQIQQVLDQWSRAFERKDVTGVMAAYAPDVTAYDIEAPLEYRGADAYREDYAQFFALFAGPLRNENRDIHIEASQDLGLAYGLERVAGTLKNGSKLYLWMRFTEGLRKTPSGWRITHEHISVPANLSTGRAESRLTP